MTENNTPASTPRILSSGYLREYILFSAILVSVIGLYHIFSINPFSTIGHTPFPPGVAGPWQGPGGMPNIPGQMYNIWPLWGTLTLPSLEGVLIAGVAILLLAGFILALKRSEYKLPSLSVLVVAGLFLILLTNLIHGWSMGIESTISGMSEMYWDITKVVTPISFISNYNSLQANLSLHAQTQPPGAVLTIHLLSLIFQEPAAMAIGLSVIAGLFSAFFINRIYEQIFNKETAKYGALLYLLLPAIQVYYLANIYAIVATLATASLYFYLHANKIVRMVGTFVSIFLGTFISFLFVYIPLALLLYELLAMRSSSQNEQIGNKLSHAFSSLSTLIIVCLGIGLTYIMLNIVLGFNYVDAFLYASSLENPGGFMLFSNLSNYVVTRLEDFLDIVVFFGPVLGVLAYEGLRSMRTARAQDRNISKAYNLTIASLVALLLLFLTGAPKKGETARICMFVLPFLLIPVLFHLDSNSFSRIEKMKLLLLVFGQAIVMQLFATYIW